MSRCTSLCKGKVDVDYPSKLHKLHSNMPFLPERMKIDKTQKLVCNLCDYHDLYVQSNTLLLADVFENFRKACIKTYELDPAHFI